jgi:hypothetical protein
MTNVWAEGAQSADARVHWCLGMRSSGSTWLFNVARKVALVTAPDRPVICPYVVNAVDIPNLDDPVALVIIKSHQTDNVAAELLGRRSHAIWISIRDPRDCVASLMQYQRVDFEVALRQIDSDARYCAKFLAHPRACMLRYEAGFVDSRSTIQRIAARFGRALPPEHCDRIFAETRRQAVDAFIRQIDQLPTAFHSAPGDLVDLATQWHSHHADRTGEIGRWRGVLTRQQAMAIELRLSVWMESLGYRTELL